MNIVSNPIKTEIEIIDNQHDHLTSLINILYDSIRKKNSLEIINSVIKQLVNYSKYHFKTEEFKMQESNFIDVDHIKEHESFKIKVKEFEDELSSIKWNRKKRKFIKKFYEFLETWWYSHLNGTDKRYIGHIK